MAAATFSDMVICSPPTLLELPDALLVQCLASLPLQERLETVSLVCKRLCQLCLAPELLRSVQLGEEGPMAMPRCEELVDFLAQHAQHVRRLTLHLQLSKGSEAAAEPAEDELLQYTQLRAAVGGCLAACAASSSSNAGLEELVLSGATPAAQVDHWLPHLPRLQELWVGRELEALALPPAITCLSALRELGLRGSRLLGSLDELRLPLSLTRLQVTGHLGSEVLEHQLARLTNLQALETARCGPGCDAAMAAVTALSGLHTLHIDVCDPLLPGWLPTLTRLRQLVVSGDLLDDDNGQDPEAIAAEASRQLDAALAPLHQLTSLALLVLPLARVPQAVAHMPLERLIADTYFWPCQAEGLPFPCPMLTSLRWLGLDWQVAQNSLEALAAASQLEHFGLTSYPDSLDTSRAQALWQRWCDWAATHPPLRCLSLEPDQSQSNRGSLHAHVGSIVALARRRPELCIRSTAAPPADLSWCRSSEPDVRSFFFFAEELLSCPAIPT